MLIEFIAEWWWWLPVVGILGGGSSGLNPFSKDFSKRTAGSESQGFVSDPGKQERAILNSLQSLNAEQREAIIAGLTQSRQPISFQSLALTPEDQAALDQAYTGAEAGLRRSADLYGQDMAGTRGLNRSDTPVSEAVLREFLPMSLRLQSEKAQQGLGLGLQMRQLGENARQFNLSSLFQGAQITPTAGLALMGNRERTRMARAGVKSFNWNQPSPMDNMEQASRIYSNVMQGSQGFIGMSDERLKREIRPVAWQWKDGEPGEYLGVIAQQVEQSHPHLVSYDANGFRRVDYGAMVAMLLAEREHLYAQLAQQEQAA